MCFSHHTVRHKCTKLSKKQTDSSSIGVVCSFLSDSFSLNIHAANSFVPASFKRVEMHENKQISILPAGWAKINLGGGWFEMGEPKFC